MSAIHTEASPLKDKTVRIRPEAVHFQFPDFGGSEFVVEDWWDRISDSPWVECKGNPACIVYGVRGGVNGIPPDDEVLYGKTPDGYGHLVHISEIVEVP